MRTKDKKNHASGERLDLDRQYGAIGISAVAAAVRYQRETASSLDETASSFAETAAVESGKEREDVAA
jgi:hypothetical protein